MIRRGGPQSWSNVHVTFTTDLSDLIDIDNADATGTVPANGFALLRQTATAFEDLIRLARESGQPMRGLGSGWALTDIAVTQGWLLNSKPLNGCFDIPDPYFDPGYDQARRPYVVVAQCGTSMGELNAYLETPSSPKLRRSLKTAGIGTGQTIAGAISGNTHGSAVKFGSTPDFVVGIQLITGTGTSLWLERLSHPVLNESFVRNLGATLIRDDELFDAAVVSFGGFGIIAAVAIETDSIYHLTFPEVRFVDHATLKNELDALATLEPNTEPGPYHYEFIFDPYAEPAQVMIAAASKYPYDATAEVVPPPVWIVRDKKGFAYGDRFPRVVLDLPLVTSRQKTAFQFKKYQEQAILKNARATPGQLFTATITYWEGYTESAFGVSIRDAITMIDTSTRVIKELNLPCMSQVRVMHPSHALLGFTGHYPKTAVFEFGLANDESFRRFEDTLTSALHDKNVPYTLHWSKNSGITRERLEAMYSRDRIDRWRAARLRVFNRDPALMKLFTNAHLERAGLA